LSMDKLLKVAVPLIAATVVVPLSVPPLGLVPIVIVTLTVLEVWFPNASCIPIITLGVMMAPALTSVGCWMNASLDAAAGETLKLIEVSLGRPGEFAVSVYPVPALVIVRSLNVATPLMAFTVVVPLSVSPLVTNTVTLAVLSTGFPRLSSI
jgi:hypothetical protein